MDTKEEGEQDHAPVIRSRCEAPEENEANVKQGGVRMGTKRSNTQRPTATRNRRVMQERNSRKKVTRERVDQFYAALGISGLSTLPPMEPIGSGVNSVLTANSGV